MFTLNVDVPVIKVAIFAQGTSVVADIKIWHKRIGHVNVQRLTTMQNHNIVIGISKFKFDGMQVYVKDVNLENNPSIHSLMKNM